MYHSFSPNYTFFKLSACMLLTYNVNDEIGQKQSRIAIIPYD